MNDCKRSVHQTQWIEKWHEQDSQDQGQGTTDYVLQSVREVHPFCERILVVKIFLLHWLLPEMRAPCDLQLVFQKFSHSLNVANVIPGSLNCLTQLHKPKLIKKPNRKVGELGNEFLDFQHEGHGLAELLHSNTS